MGISTVGLTAHFELKLKNHCFKSCVTINSQKKKKNVKTIILPPKSIEESLNVESFFICHYILAIITTHEQVKTLAKF